MRGPGAILLRPDSSLGEGITKASSALAQALGQRNALQRQEEERQRQQQTVSAFAKAISSGQDPSQAITALGTLENVDPKLASQLISPLLKQQKTTLNNVLGEKISAEDLISLGVEPQRADILARIYNNAPQGTKNNISRNILDTLERTEENVSPSINKIDGKIDNQESKIYEYPKINNFSGLNRNARDKRKSDYLKINTKSFQDLSKRSKDLKIEAADISRLQKINESGKLPSGITKLVEINQSTGELRYPANANAATQEYVKILNSFMKNAKSIYGSRLTNFDVANFRTMLPSLANTDEGRKVILRNMGILNKALQLRESSLKKVYSHYGLDKIDTQQAEMIAEDLRQDEENALLQEYINGMDEGYELTGIQPIPKGKVSVIDPEGNKAYILQDKLDEALKEGFKLNE